MQTGRRFLKSKGVESREIIRTMLSIEEVLLRYQKHFGSDAQFTLDLAKRFGHIKIRITVPGETYDPLNSASQADEDAYLQRAMVQMGQIPSWRYARGKNDILCSLTQKKLPQWVGLVAAISGQSYAAC